MTQPNRRNIRIITEGEQKGQHFNNDNAPPPPPPPPPPVPPENQGNVPEGGRQG
jgi:hypothetical protein